MSKLDYYRITVLSINNKIQLQFRNKKLAVNKIVESKIMDKEFIEGRLEEKINGKWELLWCLK